MEFQIVGVQEKEFKADNGNMIHGYQLHCQSKNRYVDGFAVDKFFVTSSRCDPYTPLVGDNIDISFNRYGKVDRVSLL